VLKLRQFNLEFAFAGAGALGENIENERSAIEHLALENGFKIPALGGREVVVKDDRVHFVLPAVSGEFIRLAAADEGAGHRNVQFLRSIANDLAASGGSQLFEFGEGILKVPSGACLEFEADKEDSLRCPAGCFDECFQRLSSAQDDTTVRAPAKQNPGVPSLA